MLKRLLFHRVAVLIAALAVSTTVDLLACGVSWLLPKDHFDGVNEYGYVSYWEQVGELDLKDGFRIPLVIGFESNRESSSPYLGQGWILSLLDSRIIQTSERDFQMIMPDGYNQSFWREKTPELLTGQSGWRAEIKGDTITAYASCGWRLVFTKGKLSAITTPKNRTFDYVFNGGKVSEIREKGETVLRVGVDTATGVISGLSYGNQRVGIGLASKPQVQSINGQNLVTGMQPSLGWIELPDGRKKDYGFSVNENVQPTLTVSQEPPRVIVWDPATKRIVKDGDWNYQITPAKSSNENAAIGRANPQGKKEFWLFDGAKGQEITESIDGVRTVTTKFTSGLLNGKLRERSMFRNGELISKQANSYDELGVLIRKRQKDPVDIYIKRDPITRSILEKSIYNSGALVSTIVQTLSKDPTKPSVITIKNESSSGKILYDNVKKSITYND